MPNRHYAFVLIKVQVGKVPSVAQRLYNINEVREIFMVTGPFDVLAIIETESYERLGDILAEEIQKIPGIVETQTLMAFRTYKYLEK
ncbi:MAG: Lrp/AsnC ligand binding domain-containing protein [Candidatus Hydrothermales bacterium]